MQPIEFQCSQLIPAPAEVICAGLADTSRWSEFSGNGILPGIQSAQYEQRTAAMVGSRIRVRNTDGSEHVEEIYAWVEGQAVGMRLQEFTPPLKYLATHFTEDWRFEARPSATFVTRTIRMFPRGPATYPAVWLISRLFRRAIARHLADIAAAAA
ncbi:MAG: SRPBCC family protein [Anaerolineales bacterium]|nr:SRPBCC family protein [Anaerolineales bacterium]